MKSYHPDGELVHSLCEPMRKALIDETCGDASLASIAYLNLAVFVSIVFCFLGLEAIAAISYVAIACAVFYLTAALGRYACKSMDLGSQFVVAVSIVVVNELALLLIFIFDIAADERAASMTATAVVISASFISVHLCARHTFPLILSKLLVVAACSVFLIFYSNVVVSSSEVLSLLMVAFLIMIGTGYWIVLRRRQEIYLQVQLQQMKAVADNQNTKLIKVLEEKEHSQKLYQNESELRQKLITHIGHDLRQPISAAIFMLLKVRESQQSDEQALLVDDTRECIQSAGRMIENIVQYSHYDNLTIEVNPALVCLDDILRSLAREYSVLAEKEHCTLRFVSSSMVINIDPDLLKRILRNLIVNVIRHSDATKLLLGVRHRTEGIELWVLDNGCGLPQVDTFFKKTVSNSTSYGLGLGMQISQQLAQTCGAQLKFYSRQGEGTLCSLLVPNSLIVESSNLVCNSHKESKSA